MKTSKLKKHQKAQKQKKSFLGSAKQSEKGVTKDDCRNLSHELYKQVLTDGETVRPVNTRTASSKHQLMTVVCNKKSLCGYDDKSYILGNRTTTLPYSHQALREEESTIEQSPPVKNSAQLQAS